MEAIHNGRGDAHASDAPDAPQDEENGGLNKTVATVVVVAAGAALFEAALLPGLVLGVAAMAAPKYLPKLAGALTPLFKSTVRGTFKLAQKSKEAFAEAHEHVNDIVAEVRAEDADSAAGGGRATVKHARPREFSDCDGIRSVSGYVAINRPRTFRSLAEDRTCDRNGRSVAVAVRLRAKAALRD